MGSLGVRGLNWTIEDSVYQGAVYQGVGGKGGGGGGWKGGGEGWQ